MEFPRIHPPFSRRLHALSPSAPTNTSTSSTRTGLLGLDGDSAILLGAIALLLLGLILWIGHIRVKRRRQQAFQELQDIEQQSPIYPRPRRGGSVTKTWSGTIEERGGMRGDTSLPPYSPPKRASQLERQWWGSVAGHGSTARAHKSLPPLPRGGSQSSDNQDLVRPPLGSHSSSTNNSTCSHYVDGYDWGRLKATQRLDGFNGLVWETERWGVGLDQGGRVNSKGGCDADMPRPVRTRTTSMKDTSGVRPRN